MSALLAPEVRRYFCNTGRENEETLRFLVRVEELTGQPITWLEWRPPPTLGDPPGALRYEIVNFKTANRTGKPFEDFMRYINAYRASKSRDIVTPWAKQRICTGYLKHKVADKWIDDLGDHTHTRFIGLRSDEPTRVRDLTRAETRFRTFRCPLADARIILDDVNSFWRGRPEDLQLQPHEGNCANCWLKDEADLARLLLDESTDPEWWIKIQEQYPGFGGFNKVPYRQLRDEGPYRIAVEDRIRGGGNPLTVPPPEHMTKRRVALVTRQELRRVRAGSPSMSCSCEASMDLPDL